MKIWHRVTFNKHDAVDAQIEALDIKYKKTPGFEGHYLLTFEMEEPDPRWPKVTELMLQKGKKSLVNTVFTEAEIRSAQLARLIPTFEQGYPQPEETWVTNPVNYDDYCPQCGTFQQTASFRLKREPNLRKNDFMSLYWTYALFCTPQVLKELEAQQMQGFEAWDAIIDKTGVPSEKITQLFIPSVANPGLIRVEDLRKEMCCSCGITRYYPHIKGVMYLKQDTLVPNTDIMQTYEWFGSGHAAYREILISNKFARLILDKGWKGVALKVVELI